MKTFLGNSPWLDEKDPTKYGVRAGSRWPHFQKKGAKEKIGGYVPFPHFLASAAAVLEADKEDVLLVDGVAEGISIDDFVKRIKDYMPDIVLLEVSTPSIEYDLKIAERIKSTCNNLKIAFCGLHAPMYSKDFLAENQAVDFVLFGEYEYTLRELIDTYKNGKAYENVKGLILRGTNGELIINERMPLIEDLDRLPFYAYHFLPMNNYRDMPCGLPSPSVQMWTSRGCPYKCSFCAWPQIIYGGHRYRVRSVNRILDELEFLIKKYGFKSFYFDDDTVNICKKRMLELCREIKKRINLPWAIMARADTMDRELLTAFKEAGLYSLKYGVESGDQKLVNDSGKKLDLEKVREIVAITKELGIKVHLTFAFGLPGETKKTIKKTTNFALKLDPESIQFSIVTPFPGSRLYEMAEKKGWLVSKDWSKFNGSSSSVVRTANLTARDMEEAIKSAYERWIQHQKEKINNALKKRIKERSVGLNEKIGKTLIIRTSFLAHFEAVLDLVHRYSGGRASVLGQPVIEDRFGEDNRIERLFIYENGFLNERNLKREMVNEIIKERFDTAVILYSNSPKETYDQVEKAAKTFEAGQIIGIDPEGCFRKI